MHASVLGIVVLGIVVLGIVVLGMPCMPGRSRCWLQLTRAKLRGLCCCDHVGGILPCELAPCTQQEKQRHHVHAVDQSCRGHHGLQHSHQKQVMDPVACCAAFFIGQIPAHDAHVGHISADQDTATHFTRSFGLHAKLGIALRAWVHAVGSPAACA